MGNYISQEKNVVINAPFDNSQFAFDPRSPTTAFNRTPVRVHLQARLKVADLADCRSPMAGRTPIRRNLFAAAQFDPRSPMANRTPLRNSATEAQLEEEQQQLVEKRLPRRRRLLSQFTDEFDDAQDDLDYASAADEEESEFFEQDELEGWSIRSIEGLRFDDDEEKEEEEEEKEVKETEQPRTPVVAKYDLVLRDSRASLSAHMFASPACKLARNNNNNNNVEVAPSTPGKLNSGFVHRSRIAFQQRLVASCPNSPSAA